MEDTQDINNDIFGQKILDSLGVRSFTTRLLTVLLVSALILAATSVALIIALNSNGQESFLDKLVGSNKSQLEPGDIVYFNTQKNDIDKKHTGIYLGNNVDKSADSIEKTNNEHANKIKEEQDEKLPTSENGKKGRLASVYSGSRLLSSSTLSAASLIEDFQSDSAMKAFKDFGIFNREDNKISSVATSISKIILNLSIIIFLGFVMRAILVFIRYYMQLGTDYENQRLAYMISRGDVEKFGTILSSLRENNINFEKTPSLPQEKIILAALDVLKEQNKSK